MGECFAGIDVSKGRLDVAVAGAGGVRLFHVSNTPGGRKSLAKKLAAEAPTSVVMESSGGYERQVWRVLEDAGLPVTVMNAVRTKHFAAAMGRKDKTDKVDACVLAEFGSRMRPQPTAAPDTQTEALAALVTRRHQLVEIRACEKARLNQLPPAQHGSVKAHIRFLRRQIEDLERAISAAIKARPQWAERDRLLRTIKGVGPILSATVIAHLPEAGEIPHKRLASLVGVAPYARESGEKLGRRRIWGGRSEVRHVLYMATVSALRSNPAIRELYTRLQIREKEPKVAIVACMHKLLRVMNAVLARKVAWSANRHILRAPQSDEKANGTSSTRDGEAQSPPNHTPLTENGATSSSAHRSAGRLSPSSAGISMPMT
jgi:transposase